MRGNYGRIGGILLLAVGVAAVLFAFGFQL
jgi:hypothetical protein